MSCLQQQLLPNEIERDDAAGNQESVRQRRIAGALR